MQNTQSNFMPGKTLFQTLQELESNVAETLNYVVSQFGKETEKTSHRKSVEIPEVLRFSMPDTSDVVRYVINNAFLTELEYEYSFFAIDTESRCQIADALLKTYTGQ